MLVSFLILAASLAALVFASDKFIEAAEKIGLSLGISPFIIGVTIVAFGTSLPELAASISAVYQGTSELVISNVVGSNVTNILLVLGLTALVGKVIKLDFDVMDTDMPLLFGSAFFLFFVASDLKVTTFEAIILLCGLVTFLINSVSDSGGDNLDNEKAGWKAYAMLIAAGVVVYLGAEYTITAIKAISDEMGIAPAFMGETIVALGTSLPEVVVSLAAARRGQHAIAVGNVLGSNLFNTYAVIGIPALLGDLVIPQSVVDFSLPFMVAVTIMFGMICLSKRITKWEGVMLILFYAFYIEQLVSKVIS